MTTLNNELSKKLSELNEEYEALLRPLLNDLANANTNTEETLAKEKFRKHLSEFVKEGDRE
jgi:hypothetical protein